MNGAISVVSAAPGDCIQDGGDTFCIYPKPTEWRYGLCDEAGAFPIRWRTWCPARGGVWVADNYDGHCEGATPDHEDNLKERATKFTSLLHGQTGTVLDTGWKQTINSNLCWSGSPTYKSNVLIRDFRRFYFSNAQGVFETISAIKGRDLECPVGTYSKYDKQNNIVCVKPYTPPKGCTADAKGNPCSITTGNKFQIDTDFIVPNSPLLNFKRTYNSLYLQESNVFPLGQGWTHNYNQKLLLWRYSDDGRDPVNALADNHFSSGYVWGNLVRADGKVVDIYNYHTDAKVSGESGWFISRDQSLRLIKQQNGLWRVDQLKTGIKEYYDQTGKLIKMTYPNGQFINLSYANVQLNSTTLLTDVLVEVTDHFGRSLQFSYNTQGLISSVTLPNTKQITYQYDVQNRLVGVTRPSYGTKTYHYSENSTVAPSGNPNLLTGITDEVDKRYANYAYDIKDRGVLTEHAGNSQQYTLQHTDNYTLVTDPNGTAWRYNKVFASGSPRVSTSYRADVQQIADEYDQAGNLTKKIEKGQTTTYSYDLSRNLETSRTEAVGTAQERVINTTWHADFPKPTQIQEVAQGQVLRTTTYTYDNKCQYPNQNHY